MTRIEWADKTWNPVTGCTKISEGCQNCYAERMACRLAHMGIRDYQDVTDPDGNPGRVSTNLFKHWNGKTVLRHDELYKPLKWRTPKRIFVCSMGDLFHESVKFDYIHRIWDVMKACPQHIFMILTKRPDIMNECVSMIYRMERLGASMGFWRHVWLGVTAENQEQADRRIPILLNTPSEVRFVSIEPMLSPVDLYFIVQAEHERNEGFGIYAIEGIDWVICGGETGQGARQISTDWVIDLKDQCVENRVPFFFKQHGGKNKSRVLEGTTWEQFPAVAS